MNQLLIYAGLFVLDYAVDAREIKEVHLRIYQNEEVVEFRPSVEDIVEITRKIEEADKIIEAINADGVL